MLKSKSIMSRTCWSISCLYLLSTWNELALASVLGIQRSAKRAISQPAESKPTSPLERSTSVGPSVTISQYQQQQQQQQQPPSPTATASGKSSAPEKL